MKKNILQLIVILVSGCGIIGVMLLLENAGIGSIASVGEEKGTSFQELQREINEISKKNWDPIAYSTLTAKIHTSKANEFITADVEIDLQKKLDLYYVNKMIETAQKYLQTNSGNYTKIITNISQLISATNIAETDKKKLSLLKNTLEALNYYTVLLPNEVSNFINRGFTNFNENQYEALKRKLTHINGLLISYKTNPKIQTTSGSTQTSLDKYHDEYITWSIVNPKPIENNPITNTGFR